jgi:hypothetical protein
MVSSERVGTMDCPRTVARIDFINRPRHLLRAHELITKQAELITETIVQMVAMDVILQSKINEQ